MRCTGYIVDYGDRDQLMVNRERVCPLCAHDELSGSLGALGLLVAQFEERDAHIELRLLNLSSLDSVNSRLGYLNTQGTEGISNRLLRHPRVVDEAGDYFGGFIHGAILMHTCIEIKS